MIINCSSGERLLSPNGKDNPGVNELIKNIDGELVIPRDANKIIIPFFHNYTNEPSISEKLTLKVRRFISMDGRLAVVSNNEDADLRLSGIVALYQVQPVQYGNYHEPIRKRLRIAASIKLFDLISNKEILYDGEIQAFEIFSPVIPPVSSELAVQDNVIENLSRRISVKVIDGWYTELMTDIEKGKK